MNKNYIVSTKDRYTVQSDWLKQWEYEGLEDLLTSPMVYWNSADYGMINIAVSSPDVYQKKTQTVDKLFSIKFEFEIDNQYRTQ